MTRRRKLGALNEDDIAAAAARSMRDCRLLPDECRDACRKGVQRFELELREHPETSKRRVELDRAPDARTVLLSLDDFCASQFKSGAQKIACLRGGKFAFDESTRISGVPDLGKPRRVRIIREH